MGHGPQHLGEFINIGAAAAKFLWNAGFNEA
jgi:hypothetical protein